MTSSGSATSKSHQRPNSLAKLRQPTCGYADSRMDIESMLPFTNQSIFDIRLRRKRQRALQLEFTSGFMGNTQILTSWPLSEPNVYESPEFQSSVMVCQEPDALSTSECVPEKLQRFLRSFLSNYKSIRSFRMTDGCDKRSRMLGRHSVTPSLYKSVRLSGESCQFGLV